MGKRVLTLDRGHLRERTVAREPAGVMREVPFLPLG
jgi:hypothetical protein